MYYLRKFFGKRTEFENLTKAQINAAKTVIKENHNFCGAKLRKQSRKGTVAMRNPGGTVSEYFRNLNKEQALAKINH